MTLRGRGSDEQGRASAPEQKDQAAPKGGDASEPQGVERTDRFYAPQENATEGPRAMNENNVVILPVVTRLDVPAERVLNAAIAADLDGVVVIGKQKDGFYYFSSSIADGGDVLWQLEWAKLALMRAGGAWPEDRQP